MINEGIAWGNYEMVGVTAHKDSEKFQSFPYRNFKPSYSDMRPVSKQSALLFATVKNP